MSKLSFTPSPLIEGKFRIVNTHMPVLHSKIGMVDFRTITEEQAEALVAYKCYYIERITEAKALKKDKNDPAS